MQKANNVIECTPIKSFSEQIMQRDHEDLKKLRVEVQRLEAECRQGKTLNKNLTQIKGEKGILEEKVICWN